MNTSIKMTKELRDKLREHAKDGESLEDVIIKLLDFDDKYGSSEPVEFEVNFDDRIIKVFRVNDTLIEYFTPSRKFSTSFHEWNLPTEFHEEWISFIASSNAILDLLKLGEDNLGGYGCFVVRQI